MRSEPRPRWTIRLFEASTVRWPTPAAPCWFHRLMQRWFLGVIWERLDD